MQAGVRYSQGDFMKDPKQTSVTGRVTGHPCDVEVTSLHGIEGTEAGSPPRGVAIRLDSPAVPASSSSS